MKKAILVSMITLLGVVACGKDNSPQPLPQPVAREREAEVELPTLHKVNTHTFTEAYKGSYQNSALFLTTYSITRNHPELLYDVDEFTASLAGDDFSLIADLGRIPLESVNALEAFNLPLVSGGENSFKRAIPVQEGHTYAVVLNSSDVRGLLIFQVDSMDRNGGAMTIRYVVKSYSIMEIVRESPGFNWK